MVLRRGSPGWNTQTRESGILPMQNSPLCEAALLVDGGSDRQMLLGSPRPIRGPVRDGYAPTLSVAAWLSLVLSGADLRCDAEPDPVLESGNGRRGAPA